MSEIQVIERRIGVRLVEKEKIGNEKSKRDIINERKMTKNEKYYQKMTKKTNESKTDIHPHK